MNRVVVAHGCECFRKPVLLFKVEIRVCCEHAMIVGWRGPYLTKAAFGHQALVAHSIPKRAADSAGAGSPVQDSSHYFNFAGPCITMLAYVAVKAQGLVFASFVYPLLLQEVNGKNRSVSAVSATERERPIPQIRDRRNWATVDRYDLGHPAQVSIAHGDRTTGVAAPLIRLKVGEVRVPGDIDTRQDLGWLAEERHDLRFVTLK